jgi:hypothetical protein
MVIHQTESHRHSIHPVSQTAPSPFGFFSSTYCCDRLPITPSPSNRMLKKSSGLEKAEVQVEAERGSDFPHLSLSLSLSLDLNLSRLLFVMLTMVCVAQAHPPGDRMGLGWH